MFQRYHHYGPELNSHDVIKFTALVLMLIGHVGGFLYPETQEFRLVGRFAFPLFLFLVGYALKYEFRRDIALAAVAVVVADLLMGYPPFPLTILVTIMLTRMILLAMQKKKILEGKELWAWFVLLFVLWIPSSLLLDYGSFAVMFAVCGYLVRKKRKDWQAKTFYGLTLLSYLAVQSYSFDFNIWQMALLATGMLGGGYLLMRYYHFQVFNVKGWEFVPVMFAARYALIIYALHVIVFKFISIELYPEMYMGMGWHRFL